MSTDILAARTISALPVSVGTSLALESIFKPQLPPIDEDRIIPQQVNLTDYQGFWFNLSTLYRNLFSSVTKEDAVRASPGDWVEALIQEIDFISELVATESTNRTRAYFYICEYTGLRSNNFVQLRADTTESQKVFRAIHNQSIGATLKHFKERKNEDFFIFDHDVKPKTAHSAMIMTHVCQDLLSYKNFRRLDLIESHTGILKSKHQWNSKYHNGKELSMMPFMEGLLKVFGDSQTYKPMDVRLRKAIIELAIEKRWTPVTTEAKIKMDLDSLPNRYYADVVKSLL